MGKKWIYRLKKEDFNHVAQRLNVALKGRLDDIRKKLSDTTQKRRTTHNSSTSGPSWKQHTTTEPAQASR